MALIKSGSYIDIFYAKTCATTKISTVAGYHVVLAMLLFIYFFQNFVFQMQTVLTQIRFIIIETAGFKNYAQCEEMAHEKLSCRRIASQCA